MRLYKAKKRVQDPELDNLINPHEVKHWMDPKIIPFGWGLFAEEEDDVLVLDKDIDGAVVSFINDLASTNYILDEVNSSKSESKGRTSAAAVKLDTMIDMERDKDAVSVKAGVSKLKINGVS